MTSLDTTASAGKRWEALARTDALFTQPYFDLDPESARAKLDPDGRLGAVAAKRVLCLAGGGGRQSVAFALLGADVTVLDLSEAQLQRDRDAAVHHGLRIQTEQGDMRDLSRFDDSSFDIVWQPYSINFVPDVLSVFAGVARVIRPNGTYHVMCANPFTIGLTTRDWTGDGYPLRLPYTDGTAITSSDEPWVYDHDRQMQPIPPAREYRHTLSALVDALTENGFVILHITEHTHGQPDAAPGSWEHFTTIAPPWLTFWTRYHPNLLRS